MTKEEIKLFNELAKKVCECLKSKDDCRYCPFRQWDGYFDCESQLDEDASKILLQDNEVKENE